MMPAPNDNNSSIDALKTEMTQLYRQQRELETRLAHLDERLDQLTSVTERRRQAVRKLHGTVTYCGDIVSPTDEPWDAER